MRLPARRQARLSGSGDRIRRVQRQDPKPAALPSATSAVHGVRRATQACAARLLARRRGVTRRARGGLSAQLFGHADESMSATRPIARRRTGRLERARSSAGRPSASRTTRVSRCCATPDPERPAIRSAGARGARRPDAAQAQTCWSCGRSSPGDIVTPRGQDVRRTVAPAWYARGRVERRSAGVGSTSSSETSGPDDPRRRLRQCDYDPGYYAVVRSAIPTASRSRSSTRPIGRLAPQGVVPRAQHDRAVQGWR